MPATDTPASPHDQLSSQTVSERPARPIVQRTIQVGINLRILAGLGAGLIVLGAFLPWIDPTAQAALGGSRIAPVIQGWPSLLIGLITLGVLALPHADGSKWVSLPAAALGLAAAVIAVASAIATANSVAQVILRFPDAGAALVNATGSGVIVTVAGGILCVVTGLSHPPAPAMEARLDLRPGQPVFAVVASGLVAVALIAGLIGAWIGSGRAGRPETDTAIVQPDVLATPVIDVQVTPLASGDLSIDKTPPGAPSVAIPTPAPPPTNPPVQAASLTPPPAPTPTATVSSPLSPSPTSTQRPTGTGTGDTATPTPSATLGSSPLTPAR